MSQLRLLTMAMDETMGCIYSRRIPWYPGADWLYLERKPCHPLQFSTHDSPMQKSVVYLAFTTTFKALCCRISIKGGAHIHFLGGAESM